MHSLLSILFASIDLFDFILLFGWLRKKFKIWNNKRKYCYRPDVERFVSDWSDSKEVDTFVMANFIIAYKQVGLMTGSELALLGVRWRALR